MNRSLRLGVLIVGLQLPLPAANPIITDAFTADPAAMVHGGKVYLYTGHDEAPLGTEAYLMRNWLCYSTADMITWKAEGSPMALGAFSWALQDAWAGHVIARDGKFFWYVPMSHRSIAGFAIGVGVSDSPTGPFVDARGTALITNNQTPDGTGKTNVFSWDDIDPAAFIDDDGQAYLFWGNTVLHAVKLKANMIETDGAIQTIALPLFTEAPWVHKRNGTYYLSYAYGWEEKIAYATSPSIAGPWTFRGVINDYVYRCNTNHQSIIDFNGRAYFIYHNGGAPNGGSFRRSVCVDVLNYNADGTIQPIVQTTAGITSAPPAIATQPASQTALAGGSVIFTVAASGTPAPSYQWRKGVTAIAGAVGSTLSIPAVTAADAGEYSVVVTNGAGAVTSATAVLTVASIPAQVNVPNGDRSAQIMNLSTRGIVSTGENALIAGFVITGPAPKKLLILASGLNLARRFGLSGEIGRPQISLSRAEGGRTIFMQYNASWMANAEEVAAAVAQVGAQPLSSTADPAHGDAGFVATLSPGVYSVVVEPAPASNREGIGLIEIYDMAPGDGSRLVNISSRGRVEAGARQMMVGVVVGGAGQARLLIRGVGPTLQQMGVNQFLANPSQTLLRNQSGVQTIVATNDDGWNSAQADQAVELAAAVGAFTLGARSADSVVLRRFEPGVYSTVIAPADATPGVAMAEIYDAWVP